MQNKSNILFEYEQNSKLYESFACKVQQLLEEIISGENISCSAIEYRLKERSSLEKKIELKQDKYACLQDITDIAGVRVVTYYSDDVDKVVELVEKEFDVDRSNTIDKRKLLEPDRFGYCSVHYIVGLSSNRVKLREYRPYKGLKCEIQIRTVLQHAWAEIEHDISYKSEGVVPSDIRRNFSRLAGLLEIGDKEFIEIRNILSAYRETVPNKIEKNELDDKELDSIILNEFIQADSQITELNNTIAHIFNGKLREKITSYTSEDTVRRTQWFGVFTLRKLKNMISQNEVVAIQIAEKLSEDAAKRRIPNPEFLPKTIGIFYVCYAELLQKYHDKDDIYRYLEETNYRVNERFLDTLLEVQHQLKL